MSDNVRYGYQEGLVDNQDIDPELTYANTEDVPATGPANPDVFASEPRLFFTRSAQHYSDIDSAWKPSTYHLYQGGSNILVRGENRRRARILFWTNDNTFATFIGDAVGNAVAISPTNPLEIRATGAVYAWTTAANSMLYVIEESYA